MKKKVEINVAGIHIRDGNEEERIDTSSRGVYEVRADGSVIIVYDEIQDMGVIELRIDDQIADAMRQFLDDDGCRTCEKTRRNAEYQHETAVGHVSRAPRVEAINPFVELVFKHVLFIFSAAKIGKSNAQRKKK